MNHLRALYERGVKFEKGSGQKGMSHLFQKIPKFSAFFDENAGKFFWQKLLQHTAQLNGVPLFNAKN